MRGYVIKCGYDTEVSQRVALIPSVSQRVAMVLSAAMILSTLARCLGVFIDISMVCLTNTGGGGRILGVEVLIIGK